MPCSPEASVMANLTIADYASTWIRRLGHRVVYLGLRLVRRNGLRERAHGPECSPKRLALRVATV